MTVLLVAVGAAVGAPLRYLIDRLVQTRHDSVFPWGTLTVNVTGCLLIGIVAGLVPWDSPVMAAVGTGLCGAMTTYSTFGYDTLRLAQDGARSLAALNVVISVVAALGAGILGLSLAQAFAA